jgi:hypothetical protein
VTLVPGALRSLAGTARDAAGTALELALPASGDQLAERDPDFIRSTLPAMAALWRTYFRADVSGLEHIPATGPVLLVGNHSGGTLIADTFVFATRFYEHFGANRAFHQLAHDLVLTLPGLGLLRKYGTVAANRENARRALRKGAAVLVYPAATTRRSGPRGAATRSTSAGAKGSSRSLSRRASRSCPSCRSAARRPRCSSPAASARCGSWGSTGCCG